MGQTGSHCICPPDWEWNDVPMPSQPVLKTPLDKLGFAWKCCWCIPLRAACILICIISFLWSTLAMSSASKVMGMLFDNEDLLYWAKLFYILVTFFMVVASGVLMLGIITTNYKLLYYYLWYALFFNCFHIIVFIAGTAREIANTGEVSRRRTARLILTLMWNFLFFYFIMIVNSYKISIW